MSTTQCGSRDKQLSVGPSNVQTGAVPYFHPDRPRFLHVGSGPKDGTAVWATFIGSKKQQLRYINHTLDVVIVKDVDVIWHPHLELDVFQGRHEKEKERARHQHIINLIQENTANTSNPDDGTTHASTPTPMVLRPRPSTKKCRRTSLGTTVDSSNSGGLSDSDDYLPSPSRLPDLCEGRQLKKACNEDELLHFYAHLKHEKAMIKG